MKNALFSTRTPYRAAALVAATALMSAVAPAAHAEDGGDKGEAGAAVLRTNLGVSLLDGTADASLKATLNEVKAPETAEKTLLKVALDGVDRGRAFKVLRAKVATARAAADADRAEASSRLLKATVNVPGLSHRKPLLEVEQVTSSAVCEKGAEPVAESNVLGTVKVLGRKTELKAEGTTTVEVPKVGKVTLDLSRTGTTSTTAAATALHLKVSVNPGDLNVAAVSGDLTLVEATCTTPGAGGPADGGNNTTGGETTGSSGGDTSGSDTSGSDTSGNGSTGGETAGNGDSNGDGGPKTQTGDDGKNLAETGGSSTTPYLAGGAALLIAAGGGLVLARRRRAAGTANG